MNTRAITLIATIAVIGIVAVGAGYAYTAITVNDSNSASAKYVTLTQDDGAQQSPEAKYTFSVNAVEYFDSASYYENSAEVLAYKVSANQVAQSPSVSGYTLLKLGDVRITATAYGYSSNLPAVVMTIKSSNSFDMGTKLGYYLVDSSNAIVAKTTSDDTWVFQGAYATAGGVTFTAPNSPNANGSVYTPVTLSLCYGYANDSATKTIGQDKYVPIESPQNLSGGQLVFAVTVNEPA
ncbi:hypothetical protein AUP07_0488 [methanogenic archaeon mixed culture ISO4-G1]|nr:hypothetical protein AUP07_0488 [methanogenic archaeon mixed culture ISO4-G1]